MKLRLFSPKAVPIESQSDKFRLFNDDFIKMANNRPRKRKTNPPRRTKLTKESAIALILAAISAACSLSQAGADPNVHTMIRHAANALGIGFQKSATIIGNDMMGRGLPEDQVVVEICMRLPIILDAIKELSHENAQASMRYVMAHGNETRNAALRRLQEITIERLRENRDLAGVVIAVLEQHALAPEAQG